MRIFTFRRLLTIAVLLIIVYGKSHAAAPSSSETEVASLPVVLPLIFAALGLIFLA